jgi:hypothetical protein
MTRFKKTAARWSAGVLLLVSSVTFTSYGRPRTTLQANSDNNGILWILFNYANWDTGLISFSNLFKLPSFVWRSGPAAFDWSRAKIAASGDTAYILYDYCNGSQFSPA